MAGKINSYAYVRLIDEDIEWIMKNTNKGLIQNHVISILKRSVENEYPNTSYDQIQQEAKVSSIAKEDI